MRKSCRHNTKLISQDQRNQNILESWSGNPAPQISMFESIDTTSAIQLMDGKIEHVVNINEGTPHPKFQCWNI